MTSALDSRSMSRIGIVGLAISLVALGGAALSPWVLKIVQPEPVALDEVAVDATLRIRDRIAARIRGEEFVSPPKQNPTHWSDWYPMVVIATGVIAIAIGVVEFVRGGHIRLNASTVAVGLSAIILQYFLLLAALVLVCLLVGLILSALGIDLPAP